MLGITFQSRYWPASVLFCLGLAFAGLPQASATPANKAALERYYDLFLVKQLQSCQTCHQPTTVKNPEDLEQIPHNPFGRRLRELGREMTRAGQGRDLATRLSSVAGEDADGDGVSNEIEILLGFAPGQRDDFPDAAALERVEERQKEFDAFLSSYRWEPFAKVHPPEVPKPARADWARNEIDAFIAAQHEKRNLTPRPEAPRSVLLKRVYLDLIGLSPTPEEQLAFETDPSPFAYEKVVDRLLNDPRYGERWGRHWMDIWRYSDWAGWSGGNQIRDSKPHIWRWRDWIVESLNEDKGYDRMIMEMLAADELAPADTNAVRATGFLVRNFKLLSREQWLEDTVKHTSQAFLGLTMGCAKCHDHMYDPVSQEEYYQMRAIFEPHQVRTDRVPGELDRLKNGLVRVYDITTNRPTYFFVRGDERLADTNHIVPPGVPAALSRGNTARFEIEPVKLPQNVAFPDEREFVIRDLIAASAKNISEAKTERSESSPDASPGQRRIADLNLKLAEAKYETLLALLAVEKLHPEKDSESWKEAAIKASTAQRVAAALEAELSLEQARLAEAETKAKLEKSGRDNVKLAKELEGKTKKAAEAEKALAEAREKRDSEPTTEYKPREVEEFPATSTGRRLAFARWVASPENPLTARVAMNHVWLRHFGRGIVSTPADLGRNGARPTHPQLLDWLAAEFMARGWSMKAMHRLILTSSTYRMASTPDDVNLSLDPDNHFFWRMPSLRMEAELIRDNLLHVSDTLDPAFGGPEIDHNLGLVSNRRSLYLRIANEKEVEFLKIFDGPSVSECYQRRPSVIPQQALALANSKLAVDKAREFVQRFSAPLDDPSFLAEAFRRILARPPDPAERDLCLDFLQHGNSPPELAGSGSTQTSQTEAGERDRRRQNLVLVLFNHNDFVTIR